MSRRGRAAALAATLALAAGGCGQGDGGERPAAPAAAAPALTWEGEPREFAASAPATDRIITGTVHNRSGRRVDLDARKVQLRDRRGKRVEGSAIFLSTFVRDRYARNRPENPPPDEERRLSGTLARLEPGESVPLTVAWRAEPGVGRPVVVQVGPVALPVPESEQRHAATSTSRPCRGAARRPRSPASPRRRPAWDNGRSMATLTDTPKLLPLAERVAAWEDAFLAPGAARSYPAHRAVPEQDSPVRTPFQRDRDRIVHSKAFRRLKHKTQVFIAPEGDHYRTRLTHTLETSAVARTVARALGLNEDLTEAVALGHDVGHPPFGHVGEAVLDRCLVERYGVRFRHNEHSLRVVERIERDGRGLNLTGEVRDGILNHRGDGRPATLEGRVVRIVDRIAYINHDIDDAVRAGVLDAADLPEEELAVLGDTGSRRIDALVQDLVEHSAAAGDIVQGEEAGAAMSRLRTFMFEHVYLGPAARSEHGRIERMLHALFDHYAAAPPPALVAGASEAERIVDWLAGMTDRYAVRTFEELAVPRGF